MKIVKYGHIKPIEHFCTGCGCVYEYVIRDIKEKYDGSTLRSYVNCPVCGRSFTISREEVE